MKVLMVCLGNICRSPLAEGILNHKLNKAGLQWEVDSAGTNGYHVGENPHRLSQKVANSRGIDISCQQCRIFSKHDFDHFDKIYAMAADIIDEIRWISKEKFDPSKIDLLLNVSYPGENRDIPDPWYGGEEGYHLVYNLIEEACDVLVAQALATKNTPR
jgi:protein-tyrosine phosphatase